MWYTHVLQAIETGQMLDFVPSIRKLPNTRYCCRNLEFFPNPNISNIRQLFSAENTAKNIFVVTLATTQGPFTLLIIWVMYNIPDFCVVQNSCFLCCTKFLFFSDVQYSWFQWCTILLFSVMYNIPDYSDVQYSFILWCTIFLFSM